MKKVLSLIVFAFAAIVTNAQEFHLTPDGFVSEDGKPYLVFEREGTQEELYNRMKTALTTVYNNPKEVLSESKPDCITISSVYNFYTKIKGPKMHIHSPFSLNIFFKDNKIRINCPNNSKIESYFAKGTFTINVGKGKDKIMSSWIYYFDEDGNPKWQQSAQEYTDEVNGLVKAYMNAFDSGAASQTDDEW